MELGRLITESRQRPVAKLITDDSFRRTFAPRMVFATSRVTQLVFKRPYSDSRNADFAREHNESWAKLITNLANWGDLSSSLSLPRNERILVAGWHFPELPTVFNFAKQVRALLLVSQDAPWLTALKQAGCTLNISDSGSSAQLAKEMQAGRIVAAMLDHHHPNTRTEQSKLLGRTVNTPSGIFELSSRFGYLMVFIAPRANGVEVVALVDTAGRSPSELAQQYNNWLEAEIKRRPETWLMWQAMPMS